MGVIRLKNMQFFAYHGVYDFEKELGAPFEVDVEINASFSQAIKSDDIQETINYDSIFKLVDSIISKKKYNLIEMYKMWLGEVRKRNLFKTDD